MIEVNKKSECCGCGVCALKCPVKCISMQMDSEGFQYPAVNKEKCIRCDLCEHLCPVKNKAERKKIEQTYAFQHKNIEDRMKSTSGGAFFAIGEIVLRQKGIIYGVVYGMDHRVEYARATDLDVLNKMRGSKYVQADIFEILPQIQQDLKRQNTPVLVSGTPCQIEALKMYLKKDYQQLITVDLVCHGVGSPKVWNKYLEELEQSSSSRICQYSFRDKSNGYHKNGTKIIFENGRSLICNDESEEPDFMHAAYFAEIVSRPSCHSCRFKTRERVSDLTIFDCWSFSEFAPQLEDDKGTSSMFVHTPKGKKICESLLEEEHTIVEIDTEKIIELDGVNVIYSMIPHKDRECFFVELDNLTIKELQQKFLKSKPKSAAYLFLKKVIVNMGLLKIAQRFKFTIMGRQR